MTQKEKDLLLKDLNARLNTNLVCSIYRTDDEGVGYRDEILQGYCKGDIWYEFYFREDCSISIDNISKIKPYLFPLSSMTEEQKKEFKEISKCEDEIRNDGGFDSEGVYLIEIGKYEYKYDIDTTIEEFYFNYEIINWFLKNHFDIYGLIPMGLAIDATNKNIY